MFLIDSKPASEVINELRDNNPEFSSYEIYQEVLNTHNEDWFFTTTPSLKGNDNRLYHRVRSIFSKK